MYSPPFFYLSFVPIIIRFMHHVIYFCVNIFLKAVSECNCQTFECSPPPVIISQINHIAIIAHYWHFRPFVMNTIYFPLNIKGPRLSTSNSMLMLWPVKCHCTLDVFSFFRKMETTFDSPKLYTVPNPTHNWTC